MVTASTGQISVGLKTANEEGRFFPNALTNELIKDDNGPIFIYASIQAQFGKRIRLVCLGAKQVPAPLTKSKSARANISLKNVTRAAAIKLRCSLRLRKIAIEAGISDDYFDRVIFPVLATVKAPSVWSVEKNNFLANMQNLKDYLYPANGRTPSKSDTVEAIIEVFSAYNLDVDWARDVLDFVL